jgi:acyl-CoA synthetase (AMP-forming)/AMP-acid ligase II
MSYDNLKDEFEYSLRGFTDNPAIDYKSNSERRTLSYRELGDSAKSIAAFLSGCGIKKGDRPPCCFITGPNGRLFFSA